MIEINGIKIKSPTSFTWGLNEVASEDSGRTLDATMHKDVIGIKRKLECEWVGLTREDTANILQLTKSTVYVSVTYPDSMSGVDETRTFYTNDPVTPVQIWNFNNKRYSKLTLNFIER